jgi:hypothetical protein
MTESRRRSQRISRTELIRESREILQGCGVGNHARSAFIREISTEVVGLQRPIFLQLQPKLLPHDTEAWDNAFCVVLRFLKRYKLAFTLATIGVEAGEQARDDGTKFTLAGLLSNRQPRLPFPERVLQSEYGDSKYANPILKEPQSPWEHPKHLIGYTTLPQKEGPSGLAAGAKPSFTTPVSAKGDVSGSDSDDDFSSDFHVDEVIPPRK